MQDLPTLEQGCPSKMQVPGVDCLGLREAIQEEREDARAEKTGESKKAAELQSEQLRAVNGMDRRECYHQDSVETEKGAGQCSNSACENAKTLLAVKTDPRYAARKQKCSSRHSAQGTVVARVERTVADV